MHQDDFRWLSPLVNSLRENTSDERTSRLGSCNGCQTILFRILSPRSCSLIRITTCDQDLLQAIRIGSGKIAICNFQKSLILSCQEKSYIGGLGAIWRPVPTPDSGHAIFFVYEGHILDSRLGSRLRPLTPWLSMHSIEMPVIRVTLFVELTYIPRAEDLIARRIAGSNRGRVCRKRQFIRRAISVGRLATDGIRSERPLFPKAAVQTLRI